MATVQAHIADEEHLLGKADGPLSVFVSDEKTVQLAQIRMKTTCTRAEAAMLCGVGTTTFDQWRGKGVVPPPIEGTTRWSVAELIRRFENPDQWHRPKSALASWKKVRDENRAERNQQG